jgi:2-dehydro-3-deoxyglucarate aldolase
MTTPYVSLPNSFRQKLRDGKTLIGCWSALSSSVAAEIVGYAGFDWLLVDGEHAPNDFQTFIAQLMALKDSPSAPVVRPQWAEPVMIKRLLDIGFYNFLMPFVESGDQARAVVAATRYPPEGIRGVGTAHRSNRYGYEADYFGRINDNICVMVQIESSKAMANLDDIAGVAGVDGLFVGPSDLSAALGHFGQPSHPEVARAIERIVLVGRAHGKPTGILAPVEKDARRYLDMGMTFVAVGGDVGLLKSASKALCDRFKE